MPRFFVPAEQVRGAFILIAGRDAAHLARSLRTRAGETIIVVEDGRREHGVVVETVAPDRVEGRIAWSRDATGEPAIEVHVVQSIPARDMDGTIEALSLAGAAAIWPALTARGVSLPSQRAVAKIERWRLIAREAAQLGGRARPPHVHEPQVLDAAIHMLPSRCRILTCVIDAPVALTSVRAEPGRPVAVIIGPEGGLDASDRALLRDAQADEVHLGSRVMPARLAGFLAVSILLARGGDLDLPVSPAVAR